jgi:hypothetical protein
MDTTNPVVYAVDIGVYNLGARNQILSSTTTAWCRLPFPPISLDDVTYSGTVSLGQFSLSGKWSANCGRSIKDLARMMACDLKEGKSIALGFEAPMWFPTQREHSPALSLFSQRFPEESGHEWYLQAGAAATLKAVSLGCLLFSQVEGLGVRLAPSTDPDSWQTGSDTMILFEAFVAGGYKLGRPSGVPVAAANEWDALTAAASWLLVHGSALCELSVQPTILHEAGSKGGSVISFWSIILGASITPVTLQGPPDCEIVAMKDQTAE